MSTRSRWLPILGLLLCLLYPTGVAAQDTKRLAVLDLSGDMPDPVLLVLSDEVRAGALTALRGMPYTVMTRENTNSLLEDMGLDPRVCAAEANCEVDFGRNINAALVVSGMMVSIEGELMLTLKLYETRGGTLLAPTRITAANQRVLIDKASSATAAMIREGLGLTPPEPDPAATGSTEATASFSGGGFGKSGQLGVAAKLKEKACVEAAEQQGEQVRTNKLARAESAAQQQATAAWNDLRSEVTLCVDLDPTERNDCIIAVEGWIKVANTMQTNIPAGTEVIETDCGPREVVFESVFGDVTIPELKEAKNLLRRLRGIGCDEVKGNVSLGTADLMGLGDEEGVRRIVRKYKGQIKYCYDKRLKENCDLGGRVEIEFSIGRGRVLKSGVFGNTTGDAALADCILRKVRVWSFDKDVEMDVVYPFVLTK